MLIEDGLPFPSEQHVMTGGMHLAGNWEWKMRTFANDLAESGGSIYRRI